MGEFSGYFFDPKIFNKRVEGYKDLSPKEKWGLRVLLDFISSGDNCSFEDVDAVFMAETGFSRTEWIKIKQRLMVFDERIVSLRSGRWVSPWMMRQRKCGAISDAGASVVTTPISKFIENFGKTPEDGVDIEREFVGEKGSSLASGNSSKDYAEKLNSEIMKVFGVGG